MKKDYTTIARAYQAITPQAISSDTTIQGTILDLQKYPHFANFVLSYEGVDGSILPAIETGDQSNLSDAVSVTGNYLIKQDSLSNDDAITQATLSSSVKIAQIGALELKRYARLNITSSAITTGGIFSAVALLGSEHIPTIY